MKKEENYTLAANLKIYAKTSCLSSLYPSVASAMLGAADEIERLMMKIEKYAWHDATCPSHVVERKECTCGYDKIYE